MSLSTLFTLATLRTMVRTELLDPNAKFWPDGELNSYIERWQNLLQSNFEFVWGTASVLVGSNTTTLTLSSFAPDMMRLDAMYWNQHRLVGRSKQELDVLKRDWRTDTAGGDPKAAYQDDLYTVSLWPPPGTQGTLVFEYPVAVSFSNNDSAAMQIPAWTKYSCKNFCVHHALLRTGPNQDQDRAIRREKKFTKQLKAYATIKDNFFPDRALTMRPGGKYEGDILNPRKPELFR
jgi:hypothetical protein